MTPTKNESLPVLALLDQCFDVEIQRVSTVEFNSNSICRTFYRELRKRLEAALTREAPTEAVVACHRVLPGGGVEPSTVWRDGDMPIGEASYWAIHGYEIERAYKATPPAPQRMAQGEECPHESWDVIGGGRRCVDCRKWLGADTAEEATQPPHQDRGEVAELIELAPRAAELATRLVASGPKAAHVSASETHEIADFVHRAIAALTEAKQQGPGEAVYQFRDAYGAWRDTTKSHYDVETQHDKRILYTSPQVEAKRQAGEVIRDALQKVIDAVGEYLPPDGISQDALISKVIEATDNPEIVRAMK